MKCYRCDKDFVYSELGIIDVVEQNCCKAAVVCYECFEFIDPDMWIDSQIWKSVNPIICYDNLPILVHEDLENFNKVSYYEGKEKR